VCEGVAEFDRLSNDYIPTEELKAANDPRYHAMIAGEWDTDEESSGEFRARVVGCVEELIDAHPAQRIAVVCHGGVINSYLCHVLGLESPRGGFFYPNYTSINRIAAARGGIRSIVTINETSHLRGTGLPMGLFQGQ
jgi:probable phosphoglycerate mutase